jgi:hypothetical protein
VSETTKQDLISEVVALQTRVQRLEDALLELLTVLESTERQAASLDVEPPAVAGATASQLIDAIRTVKQHLASPV